MAGLASLELDSECSHSHRGRNRLQLEKTEKLNQETEPRN
jgi:hypothetical protein